MKLRQVANTVSGL